jgi:hypothetical protein
MRGGDRRVAERGKQRDRSRRAENDPPSANPPAAAVRSAFEPSFM